VPSAGFVAALRRELAEARGVLCVRDAALHANFHAPDGAAAWAAVSVGDGAGVLCVLDERPRAGSDAEDSLLEELGTVAGMQLATADALASARRDGAELQRDALYDPLTGLPNHVLFRERLAHMLQRAKRRAEYRFAVLFLDLDRFKVVNDSLGHHVGDELLAAVAGRLKASLRLEDTVARLGGDEFAILLENIDDIADATRVAERIQRELSAPINLSGYEVFTSTSIGIALSTSSYDQPEYLLRNADMAMYRAKASGRARYEVFDRAMHAEALARLQMETDLRHAIEHRQFHLHYQPVVSLASGRITGFEALLRWNHPVHGPIPPADFIPLAEETGMIVEIGQWVLAEACRTLHGWRGAVGRGEPLTIGVNLSARQVAQPGLVDRVAAALREAGLEPHELVLEITESVIVENTAVATDTLERLEALGVGIYMDDFGTGYSSLSYLHRLPLDALKIDRSFIRQLETDDRHLQLVRTILTLAKSVGVRVVAEGVETEYQLRHLRDLGADAVQGYFCSPPLDPAAAEALLRAGPRW
jgi:diguanylate cyclase (GGDEF)-like protein